LLRHEKNFLHKITFCADKSDFSLGTPSQKLTLNVRIKNHFTKNIYVMLSPLKFPLKHINQDLSQHENKLFTKLIHVITPYTQTQEFVALNSFNAFEQSPSKCLEQVELQQEKNFGVEKGALSSNPTGVPFSPSLTAINILFSIDQFFSEFYKKYPLKKKTSDFKLQLKERKKLSIFYGGLSKKDLHKILKESESYRGNSAKNILSLLEKRLDVALYRSHVTKNIVSARQLITHKKILVNNKYITTPSYTLNPGDIISITPDLITNISLRILHSLKTNLFKPDSSHIIASEILSQWSTAKAFLSKSDLEFFVLLILKKIQKDDSTPISKTKLKGDINDNNLNIQKYFEYYRTILLKIIIAAQNVTPRPDFFRLILKTYLLTQRSKANKLQALKISGKKPLHLEISYKLLNIIFLYAPQRIYYPFFIDVDVLRRSFTK
jgi:ribosomal protein S4